ncbi:MAG: acetate--CoA ligase family protein [Acidobacteria bacterium]|nr:acetate--CoA ligase family protein [Acidobacteriota bacterium]
MASKGFLNEAWAYRLLRKAGLRVPSHGLVLDKVGMEAMPCHANEPVVLKGLVEGLWHKSDRGLVKFMDYDAQTVWEASEAMRATLRPGEVWIGALVSDRISFKTAPGLPSEALVSLKLSPDVGWVVVMGFGGVHTESWAENFPPMLWPLSLTTPEGALMEFKDHRLGDIWLGRMRQGDPLTDEENILAYLRRVWHLAHLLEKEGADLLELNPVVLDPEGIPVALDGVGSLGDRRRQPSYASTLDPGELLDAFARPRSLGIAGVSSKEGSPGRIIFENLLRSSMPREALKPIKPGTPELSGIPCLQGISSLAQDPVDLLILCLPAPHSLSAIEELCAQGGGAKVVYLVPGGLGDGADQEGLGSRLRALLDQRRREGLWTPAVAGPNGLGFLSHEHGLNTLFIPREKLEAEAVGGTTSLISQSGAFLVTRLSCTPSLPLRFACSIGNQLDLRLSDYLRALGEDPGSRVIGVYAEGFAERDLLRFAQEAHRLVKQGRRIFLYKGGRSPEGQAAASSHTGALAGDWDLQRAVLHRAGVVVTPTMEVFNSTLSWLSAFPEGRPGRVAVISNAGYESVAAGDLLQAPLSGALLSDQEAQEVSSILGTRGLGGLVSPRLPLDLTPMAEEGAFLDCARVVARGQADTLVLGLVPLTRRLETADPAAMASFAQALAALARESGKRLGCAVEGGEAFEPFRLALESAGLPVFYSMERALLGLRFIAEAD